MSKRCENEIKRAIALERERIAKQICPFCNGGFERQEYRHMLKLEEDETIGTWIECLARGVFYPDYIKPSRRPKPEIVAKLQQDVADLKHDVVRAMANHNADINGTDAADSTPKERT